MSFIASYAALWCVVILLMLVALGLLREVTILRRSQVAGSLTGEAPLVIGSRAPTFTAVDARSGGQITSNSLRSRVSTLLFVSSQCSLCRHLISTLPSLSGRASGLVVTVCKGNGDECRRFLDTLSAGVPLILDTRTEISELYGISNYPTAVIVDAERRVRGYGYPRDARDLEYLAARALGDLHANVDSLHFSTETRT